MPCEGHPDSGDYHDDQAGIGDYPRPLREPEQPATGDRNRCAQSKGCAAGDSVREEKHRKAEQMEEPQPDIHVRHLLIPSTISVTRGAPFPSPSPCPPVKDRQVQTAI